MWSISEFRISNCGFRISLSDFVPPDIEGYTVATQNPQSEIRNPKFLVNSFNDISLQSRERADIAHSIPGIEFAGWFSFGLVTFEEAWHEEFFCQCRQANSARFTILNN